MVNFDAGRRGLLKEFSANLKAVPKSKAVAALLDLH